MKKNFKKTLAVFMAILMLLSVMGVSVYAAPYKVMVMKGMASGVKPINPKVDKLELKVNADLTVTVPSEAMYKRTGFVQDGWTFNPKGIGAEKFAFGEVVKTSSRNRNIFPHWRAERFSVTFTKGAYGEGADKKVEVSKAQTTTFPGAIFTRAGYLMIGWTTVENGSKEFDFNTKTPEVYADVVYYPAWRLAEVKVEHSSKGTDFTFDCVDYTKTGEGYISITNVGDVPVKYTLPVNPHYDITVLNNTSLNLSEGDKLELSIKPKLRLSAGNYNENIIVKADNSKADVVIPVSFEVIEHSFIKYVSDDNATYATDGTKTAVCSNGCSHGKKTIVDVGSKKIYSADNNTVIGLSKEYLHHKTVNFTAFGSGSDNTAKDVTAKKTLADGSVVNVVRRFVPTEWYVNDEFNGQFTGGNYNVKYVHRDFGNFELKITYIEEEYDSVTQQWAPTGAKDVKTFNYSIGPSEQDNQESVVPSMIVSIVFGLLGRLLELVKSTVGIS